MNALPAKEIQLLYIDPLMRGAIKKDLGIECWLIILDSEKVIKDNFLNLLCSLSRVVFSADCSAIFFLHVNFKVAFYLILNFKLRVHELVTRVFRVHHNKKS